MTWIELAEFIASLPAEVQRGKVEIKADTVRGEPIVLPSPLFVTCAMPPTKHMGGPWLFADQMD